MPADVTWEQIVAAAKRVSGQELRTAGDRASFTVRVEQDTVYSSPPSTGKPRRLGAGSRKMLERYNTLRSLRPGDYNESNFRHASYLLPLIELTQSNQ